MLPLLALVLICCDDAASAGAAYRDAQEALKQGHYDDAVSKLQEAVRFEPRETDKLLYRDREGRHGDPYYPHLVWGQARALQAKAEPDPVRQKQQLREAVFHLDLTDHAGAAALRVSVRKELLDLELRVGAPTTGDDALSALRRKIAALCDQEEFEECVALLATHPGDVGHLRDLVESKRRGVLDRYDHAMTLALDTIAAAPTIDNPRSILLLLKSALVPAAVTGHPDARLLWLREFHGLYERELPRLELPELRDPESGLDCAVAFDACALRGLEAGTPQGFRAALKIADTLRGSCLGRLAGGRDDARFDRLLTDAEQGLRRRQEALSKKSLPSQERAAVLVAPAQSLLAFRNRLRSRQQFQEDLDCWIVAARHALGDPGTMADPSALRDVAKEGTALESREGWKEAPAGFQARTLFVRGLLEIVIDWLDGGRVDERAGSLVHSARILDARVEQSWKDPLSPRIQSWLASLR